MSLIEEATVIEENEGLGGSGSFQQFLINGFDSLSKNNKATAISEALILANVVEDNELMRAAIDNNKEAFNQFFESIDYNKFSKNYGDQVINPIAKSFGVRVKEQAPIFLVGMAIGGTVSAIIRRKANK